MRRSSKEPVIIHKPLPQPVVNKVLKIERSKIDDCLLSIENVEGSNILHPCNVTYSSDMLIKSHEKFIPLHKNLVLTMRRCKNCSTVVLQWFYSGPLLGSTVVLRWFYSGPIQWFYSGSTMVLRWFYKISVYDCCHKSFSIITH